MVCRCNLIVAICASLLCLKGFSQTGPRGAVSSAWPKYGADMGNTHQGSGMGAKGTFAWNLTSQGGIATPIVFAEDGTAYYATYGGQVVAVSSGGLVKWTVQTPGFINSSVALGPNGDLYYVAGDYRLYSISPAGAIKWSIGNYYQGKVAVAPNGTIYASNGDRLYAVSPNGQVKWNSTAYDPSGYIAGPDSSVYFINNASTYSFVRISSDGQLRFDIPLPQNYYPENDTVLKTNGDVCFDMFSLGSIWLFDVSPQGVVRWKLEAPDLGASNLLAGPNATLYDYFASFLYTVDSNGGVISKSRISVETGSTPGSISLAEDGTPFLSYPGGVAACTSSGIVKWRRDGQSKNLAGITGVAPNGSLYYTDPATNRLYAATSSGVDMWSIATGGLYGDSALAADGTIYSFSNDYYLNAISPTGGVKWRLYLGKNATFPAGGSVPTASPLIGSDGTIYVQCDTGLDSVSPSGKINWSVFSYGNTSPYGVSADSSGTIYSVQYGDLVAFNTSGSQLWLYTDEINATPAIAPGSSGDIYLGEYPGTVTAIDPTNQSVVWSTKSGIAPVGYVCLMPSGGDVLAMNGYGLLYTLTALNSTTGTIDWTFEGSDSLVGPPAVSSSGTIYAADYYGGVYAIDSGGNQIWQTTGVGQVSGEITIGGDGTVYVGTKDGHVYALNPSNGEIEWSYRTSGPAGTPIIGGDGSIYVAGLDGNFYAIH